MVHYFQKEIGNYFGCIWFSRLHLTDFSNFFKKKKSGQENVKEECNSTRAILSVGDMAKYEMVEIVAKIF